MNEAQFWALIETSYQQANGNQDTQMEALKLALEKFEPSQLVEFHNRFQEVHAVAYRADLWGAAHLMNGECSDDDFHYFRGWLIAQGRKVFEAALENPDSLAEIVPKNIKADFKFENQHILSLAGRIWNLKMSVESGFYARTKHYVFIFQQNPLDGFELWMTNEAIDKQKCCSKYSQLWGKFGWKFTINDVVFGELILESQNGRTTVKYDGIEYHIESRESLPNAHRVAAELERYVKEAKLFAAEKMLELKNEGWADEDANGDGILLTSAQFIERMTLESIKVGEDWSTFWFDAAELFSDHSIFVTHEGTNWIDADI